jgi:hypothetical protein
MKQLFGAFTAAKIDFEEIESVCGMHIFHLPLLPFISPVLCVALVLLILLYLRLKTSIIGLALFATRPN